MECSEEGKKTSFPEPTLCKRYPGWRFVGTSIKHYKHEIFVPASDWGIMVFSPNGTRKRFLAKNKQLVESQEPRYIIMGGRLYAAKYPKGIEVFDILTGNFIEILPHPWESAFIYDMIGDPKRKQIILALAGECMILSNQGKVVSRVTVSQDKKSRRRSPELSLIGDTVLYDASDHHVLCFINLQTNIFLGCNSNSALGGSYLFHRGLAFHHSMYTNDLMVLNPLKNKWEVAWSPGDLSGLTYVVCCRNFLFAECDKSGPHEKYGLEVWHMKKVFDECIQRKFNLSPKEMVAKLMSKKSHLSDSLFPDC